MIPPDRIEVSRALDLMYEEMCEWGFADGLPIDRFPADSAERKRASGMVVDEIGLLVG